MSVPPARLSFRRTPNRTEFRLEFSIHWCDKMAVDPYAPCPCGSGKKFKFCCSDLVGEIEKIHRMIEGDQPRAALRHAEQTLVKHPRRASLLDLKATLELTLGEIDAARVTIDE